MKTKIFIDAAQLVDNRSQYFSCNAIGALIYEYPEYSDHDLTIAEDQYAQLFDCATSPFGDKYYRLYNKKASYEEIREIRVLALLFAAQVFKNKGKI